MLIAGPRRGSGKPSPGPSTEMGLSVPFGRAGSAREGEGEGEGEVEGEQRRASWRREGKKKGAQGRRGLYIQRPHAERRRAGRGLPGAREPPMPLQKHLHWKLLVVFEALTSGP